MNEKMTTCKICNSPIAKEARTCPNCGAANKKSLFTKWWFWGIIALLLIICMLLGSGNTNTITESTPKDSTTPATTESVPATTESVPAEPFSIADRYLEIATNADPSFNIQEKSIAFINNHPDFFPGSENNDGAMTDFIDHSITYGHLSKNISIYGDKLIPIYGTVVDIKENDDRSMTYLHIVDYDDKNYILYYLGTLDRVFEDTDICAYALPLDMVTFENMNNTYTKAVACACCYVGTYD